MKKTITINISGLVFNIEEDAYALLKNYLESIGNKFNNLAERQEIIEDIEARIAELFSEKLNRSKEVINEQDVEAVKIVMGSPDNFEEDDSTEYSQEKTEPKSQTKKKNKKFYRDTDNSVLGGVCAGTANYFNWDVALVRVIFLLSVIFLGTGVLIYILFWIATPEAKSTSEKLAAKGKNATVDNISSFVTKVKSNFDNIDTDAIGENIKTQSNKFNDFLIGTSKKINNTIRPKENGLKIVRSISTIIGFFIISAGLIIVTNIVTCLFIPNSTISDALVLNFQNSLFYSELVALELFNISLIVFNIALGLSLIITGARLVFFKNKEFIKSLNPIGSLARFITILSFMGLISSYIVNQGSHSSFSYSTNHALDYKTIVIKKLEIEDNNSSYKKAKLDIRSTTHPTAWIKLTISTKGYSRRSDFYSEEQYSYKFTDSIVELSPYIYLEKGKIMDKNVDITLYLPDNDSTILINEFDD